MRKKFRLKFLVLLSLSLIIILITNTKVNASSNDEDLESLETILRENNTNVEEQLNIMIEEYNELGLEELIKTLNEEIADHNDYLFATINKNEEISTVGFDFNEIKCKAAISIATAAFNCLNYKLSAELLTKARSNKNSKYTYFNPKYSDRVTESKTFISLAYGGLTSGNSSFEKSGKSVDNDLYYSIHGFTFKKATSKSHTVTIYDIYDFKENDNSTIENKVINIMKKAQDLRIIIPYNVLITKSI